VVLMPDAPLRKSAPPPCASDALAQQRQRALASGVAYAELWTTSAFSFLEGASRPEELVQRAYALGHRAIAAVDRASLAGVVRYHVAAKELGLPLVIGARVDPVADADADPAHAPPPLLLFAQDRASYGRLCRLLTIGRRRARKGECLLFADDVAQHADGLLAVALPPPADDVFGADAAFAAFTRGLERWRAVFDGDRLSIAAAVHGGADDTRHLARLVRSARECEVPLVAAGDVRASTAAKKPLLDVLTCIREGAVIEEAGGLLLANAERHLAPLSRVGERFAALPHALRRSVDLAERASGFSLDELDFAYPQELGSHGRSAFEELVVRTREGANERYPRGVPPKVERLLAHEFALIAELKYAPYFLTVWDLVRFARSRNILCQGRGAAANSAVCYCLGVTAVDPERSELLFERFLSKERNEPPDIDVDFEHERREEVIQYLYRRHGRDHAALTAAVATYRGRGALRDVGRVLGLAPETLDTLAKGFDHWGELDRPAERLRDLGFDPKEPTLVWLVHLAGQLQGLPRHLSQHVGGFVITHAPLCELVPIANAAMDERTTIEWDKDDLDALGILKVDVLALGMLTCVRKAFDLVSEAQETCGYQLPRDLSLSSIPPEDPAVYDMICRADTIGVFQIESRAQMSMLPRLRPRCFYDLVIEVAIVRPGPIQGDMVHPYLRRRLKEEPVDYPSDAVRGVLERTLGVPLFQEQAMALSVVAAGFTPSESDLLRRAMGSWRRDATRLQRLGAKLVAGLLERGYSDDFAQRLLKQIHGFGDYGFPESHAASFALLVYVSAWLKHHHPAAFAAALINSQPMGFYAPAQIVRDAQQHGVCVRPVDVHHSRFDCTLERGAGEREASERGAATDAHGRSTPALRLGMCVVKGVSEADAGRIAGAVALCGPFTSIEALWRTSGASPHTLRLLARADAFASFALTREQALWQVRALRKGDPAFAHDMHDDYGGVHDDDAAGDAAGAEDVTHDAASTSASAPTRAPNVLAGPGSERREAEAPSKAPTRASTRASARARSRTDTTGLLPFEPLTSQAALPERAGLAQVLADYSAAGLSLRGHPIGFLRERLTAARVVCNRDLLDAEKLPHGRRVGVCGIVLVRQRPGTASGIVFITLEDESGVANLIVRPRIFERDRRVARHATALVARGRVERQGSVVHVLVSRLESIDAALEARGERLAPHSRDFH
jgi:error-prone DNA polymerase